MDPSVCSAAGAAAGEDFIPLPWFEAIPVGTSIGGAAPALLGGYQYYVYTGPVQDVVDIYGFAANFEQINDLRMQLTDVEERDTWTPFFSVPGSALLGFLTEGEPVLLLPEPYRLMPGHKLRIFVQNVSVVNIGNTQITAVGVRHRRKGSG